MGTSAKIVPRMETDEPRKVNQGVEKHRFWLDGDFFCFFLTVVLSWVLSQLIHRRQREEQDESMHHSSNMHAVRRLGGINLPTILM